MRLIRIAWLGLALAAATAPIARAQQNPSAERRLSGKRAMQMLLMDIHLDSAQTVKVDSIVATYRTKMQALRSDDGSRDEAARKKIGQLREKQRTEVRALLTREQQAVFDQNAAKVREHGAGQKPPGSQR